LNPKSLQSPKWESKYSNKKLLKHRKGGRNLTFKRAQQKGVTKDIVLTMKNTLLKTNSRKQITREEEDNVEKIQNKQGRFLK